MKTSKRLLSILLMLTMLVSMFTVMASADVTDDTQTTDKTIRLVVGENGTVKVNGKAAKTGDRVKEGDVLTAIPDEGFKADWTYGVGTKPRGQNPVTVTDVMVEYECDICAVFTKSEEPVEDETVSVYINILNFDSVDGAKIWNSTTEVESGSLELTTEQITKGVKLTATAAEGLTYGTNYTVTWELNNDTAKKGQYFDLWKTLEGNNNSLTITFEKAAPVVTKHTLTLNQPTVGGTIKCNDISTEVKLAEGEKAALTATPKDGYKFKEWRTTSGAKVKDSESATTEITMGNTDATVTAVFEKISYTVTVKKGVNGTLKYAVNNGDRKTVTETATIPNLKQGDIVKLIATPKSNYETVWTVNGNKLTKHNEVLELTVSEDITVEVSFQKLPSDKLKLELDITNWNRGDVYAKENSEDSYRVRKNNKTFTLEEDDKVKFTAYPEDGYKAVWQLDNGTKYTGSTFTVDYEDMDDDDCVLYLSFVKKSSSDTDDYPTLTFDITGEKYGKVYRGTREYGDGDVISIKKNDKMTFKAKVTKKDYVAVWTYKGDTYVGDEYTVKMGATDAKLYVEFMDKDDIRLTELPFRDVSKRDWYYDDVVYVYRNGYMDGMSSTRFGGELNTTRGQIVTILWRLTGEPGASSRCPFNDVSSRQYYYDAVCWAYDAGVVDGFDAHTFKPDQNVTREQLAAILYRYAEYMNLSTGGSAYLGKYNDENRIANWAYDAMAWANYHGIINGTSATRISPKGYATRAQIAAMLHRFAVEFGA